MPSPYLRGEVHISSSKNAVLPILAAALLAEDQVTIQTVPEIIDVGIIVDLLKHLGAGVEQINQEIVISEPAKDSHPDANLVRRIRASFLLMGPLLATRSEVRISLPGGCAIGTRPIDLHLKGLAALGARIFISGGDVIARASRLTGAHIYLDFPSVGATENIMMAAARARGTTYIENAALEPEVTDLANFINSMGGKVQGAGSHIIKIEGVSRFHGSTYIPIPDRIEAGTFMTAAAATGGDVLINNVIPDHLKATTAKLQESGAIVEEYADAVRVTRTQPVKPVYIKTLPYPGFPTDMQAQLMAYLSLAEGSSVIAESVFENRFMHVPELLRMGASIKTEGRTAIIYGKKQLSGAHVRATDLRAGAALLIAALTAKDVSIIQDSEHIERGYEKITEKFAALGAQIKRNHG